ncbi:hypothetical protein [Mucisphaera calidilacus]|uniref:Uncharacterized protein n=1 Tax=Mucisphaera calidilacus TaxID=2527982 RepID=A0A518BVQ2_9BACT|nr:hypothetical protein [Mucisphaera calidilacus]QDU71063.1 hypothetical protein Pan265_09080 [Mucisphaera calidilacus]
MAELTHDMTSPPEVQVSYVYQSYPTDECGDWSVCYDPHAPDDERVLLEQNSNPETRFWFCVETARGLAHMLLAAVEKHDSDKRFEQLLANNTTKNKES